MSSSNDIEWVSDGENIFSESNLSVVRHHLDLVGNIVALHWHFAGAHAPTPLAFNDFDNYFEYLQTQVRPGDAIDVYPFPECDTPSLASGKKPNDEGKVPLGGAY